MMSTDGFSDILGAGSVASGPHDTENYEMVEKARD